MITDYINIAVDMIKSLRSACIQSGNGQLNCFTLIERLD